MTTTSDNQIARAVEILHAGGLVAFPTETVYGLGADATSDSAVRKIFLAKGRPSNNPLIVHVANESVARRYAATWPELAGLLVRHFWPGPLTLVVPKAPVIADVVTAGGPTVGLRCPDHPLTLELLRAFDGPIAGPSANRSMHVSPTTAQHVRDELGDRVDLILDGGSCRVGIESTVLEITGSRPRILRPGGISHRQIEQVVGPTDVFKGFISPSVPAASPGQQLRHYAPLAPAWRFDHAASVTPVAWCREHPLDAWVVLTIGPPQGDLADLARAAAAGSTPSICQQVIEMPTDARAYAHRLYATLRRLDALRVQAIWIEFPPDDPQWMAVRDRLRRATRPA